MFQRNRTVNKYPSPVQTLLWALKQQSEHHSVYSQNENISYIYIHTYFI